MSKSKKEEKSVEEEVPKEDSKEELKDKIKKPSKKETSKSKKEVKKKVDKSEIDENLPLRTLIELVKESGIRRKDIIVRLANNGYLGQFYEEEEKKRIGYPIKPTISEQEFKKIIGE